MHGIQNILCFCKRYLLSILQSQALHAEEVRLVSLPGRQTAELVQVVNHHQGALTVTGKKQTIKVHCPPLLGEGARRGGEGGHLPQVGLEHQEFSTC